MPRRKAVEEEPVEDIAPRSLRKRTAEPEPESQSTPSKRRRGSTPRETPVVEADVDVEESVANGVPENATEFAEGEALNSIEVGANVETEVEAEAAPEPEPEPEPPKITPRKRGRPPKNAKSQNGTPTSKAKSTPLFTTPVKNTGSQILTPSKQAADRSARRKSTKALIEQVVGDNGSDDEQDDENVAREIYGSSEGEGEEDDDGDGTEGDLTGADLSGILEEAKGTPSKTPGRKGRPRKVRSPTPPRDLPPHEMYFFDNKPGRPKTSNNTLSNLALLTHEEYFNILQGHKDRHSGDVEYLETLHAESFPQWTFELSQGFSLCLCGFGSKRRLLQRFAKHTSSRVRAGAHKTVMVNGYTPTTAIREILSVIGTAVDPVQRIPTSQPATMVQSIITQLSSTDTTLTVIINSIDAAPMRKPTTQAILAQLAAHPQVNLACSVDSPDFSLLWDIGVRSAFNFVFHDCTTFAPFTVELDVVDEVHELLGRKAHRVNGREGVAFVLKSLPENAKNLFRLLVGEVLIAMEDEGAAPDDGTGVEYRMVYNKAVEEFICSSEMAFRTLLKEFHDHQIIASHKDAIGTELLSVPFRKDELEAILEDLMA